MRPNLLAGVALAAAVLVGTGPLAQATVAAPASPRADARQSYADASAKAVKHGWACIAVEAEKRDDSFAYTMGLSSKGLPELGIFLTNDTKTACAALDRVAQQLLAARHVPHDGEVAFRTGRDRLVFRSIYPAEFYQQCIFADLWRKEHHVLRARGMQLIVLSAGERMPD